MTAPKPRQRKDGRWYVQPFLGTDPVTRKPIRPYHVLAAETEEDAIAEAEAWAEGMAASPTVAFALRRYVRALELAGSPANTVRTYSHLAECYVEPRIGKMAVEDVTPGTLTSLYGELRERGGRKGGPLSGRTVAQVHWLVHGTFAQLVAEGHLASNPSDAAMRPKIERQEADALDGEDVAELTRWISERLASDPPTKRGRNERAVALAARIALSTGLRIGEVCALRRRDVDLVGRRLRVSGTMVELPRLMRQESTKGKRTRNLALSDADVALMRRELERARRIWPSKPSSALVTADGGFMRPSTLTTRFTAACAALGLPEGTHFHTLRHTHASILLAAGADLKTVSERLGHAKPETTLGIYAHVMPGRDRAAAEAFQAFAESADPMQTDVQALDAQETGSTS